MLQCALWELGDSPPSLYRPDCDCWQKFGTGIGNDIRPSISHLKELYPTLRRDIKQAGGICRIWARMFPRGLEMATSKLGSLATKSCDQTARQTDSAQIPYSQYRSYNDAWQGQSAQMPYWQHPSSNDAWQGQPAQMLYCQHTSSHDAVHSSMTGNLQRIRTDSPYGRLSVPVYGRSRSRANNRRSRSRASNTQSLDGNRESTPLANRPRGRSPTVRGAKPKAKANDAKTLPDDESSYSDDSYESDSTVVRRWKSAPARKNRNASPGIEQAMRSTEKQTFDNIWLFVGGSSGFDSEFMQNISNFAQDNCIQMATIALPSSEYTLHASGAAARFLTYYDDGTLEQYLQNRFRNGLASEVGINVVIQERALRHWPDSKCDAPHHGRLDNINSTLRSFCIDGSGRQCTSKLFRASLRTFCFFGGMSRRGTCMCQIDVDTFKNRLCKRRTAALSDTLLVGEVAYACSWHDSRSPNGMLLSNEMHVVSKITSIIEVSAAMGRTLIVALDRDGDPIRSL